MSTAPATAAAPVDPLTAALGGAPAAPAPATPAAAQVSTPPTTPVAPPAPAAPAPAAPAVVETAPAKPAAPASPAGAPKRLITDEEPAAPAKVEQPAVPEEWRLEAPEAIKPEVASIEAWAKANKLSKDQAQSLVQVRAAAVEQQIAAVNDQWYAAIEKHAEFGGDKLPATMDAMKRGIVALIPDPAERKALVNSPFINHPTMVRLLTNAAKLMPQEDRVHAGAPAGTANTYPTTVADAIRTLYGDR